MEDRNESSGGLLGRTDELISERRSPEVEEGAGDIDATKPDVDVGFATNETADDRSHQQVELAVLRQTMASQGSQLESLQQDLHEAHIKHGEEVYWLQLELNSARLEKEGVEDRLAELYRDVQEMVERKSDVKTILNDATGNCTDEELIVGMKTRIDAFELTVDLMNNQMTMLKTSSDAVVASLKQDVTDLMEEKSQMEMELLNQISNLATAKRKLEIMLSESMKHRNFDVNYESDEKSADSATMQSFPLPTTISANEDEKEDTQIRCGETTQETSMSSTATVQGSSFDREDSSAHQHSTTQRCYQEDDNLKIAELQQEVSALKSDNVKLRKETGELTKELMLTRASANTALSIDVDRTDREEAIAYLNRIPLLWERAEQTIQVVESLLLDMRSKPGLSQGLGSMPTEVDKERALSTLEKAALVHGQIKMALTHIEVSFRNHLLSIQNDITNPENHDRKEQNALMERLKQVRDGALADIAGIEATLSEQVAKLENDHQTESGSLRGTLHSQLDKLKKAQERHDTLETELKGLKERLAQKSETVDPKKCEETNESARLLFEKGECPEANSQASSKGLVVSHNVMMRLQKEVLSVVEQVQEKNKMIDTLTGTIAKYKKREVVLTKELRRARHVTNETKRAASDRSGRAPLARGLASNKAGKTKKNEKGEDVMDPASEQFWTPFP